MGKVAINHEYFSCHFNPLPMGQKGRLGGQHAGWSLGRYFTRFGEGGRDMKGEEDKVQSNQLQSISQAHAKNKK